MQNFIIYCEHSNTKIPNLLLIQLIGNPAALHCMYQYNNHNDLVKPAPRDLSQGDAGNGWVDGNQDSKGKQHITHDTKNVQLTASVFSAKDLYHEKLKKKKKIAEQCAHTAANCLFSFSFMFSMKIPGLSTSCTVKGKHYF